jgi:subtilisin family serine protease
MDRVALREVLRHEARASNAGGLIPIPLPEPPRRTAAAAATGAAPPTRMARAPGPQRVLVGLRSHGDLAAVASKLRALGAEPEAFTTIGVVAATVPSGAALVSALGGDPRVAYIERDAVLRTAADPFDSIDPLTGIKHTWAYDEVRAAPALAAAGGGSSRTVAVIDTGVDLGHPELAGQVASSFNTRNGGPAVRDAVGHGTFVSGLLSALDGNELGGKGVAGSTKLVAVRAESRCPDRTRGCFSVRDVVRGIEGSIRRRADVLNLSLAGRFFSRSQARVLEAAFFNDALPVAASGNNAQAGNPLEFPAAALGGDRGARGLGLSVAATNPRGGAAAFSNHNRFVSLAAPGAGAAGCEFGVFSTLPSNTATAWDDARSCSETFARPEGRYAYAEGTSFATPIASGIAALVWQVERRLASEQVAEVLTRSARQTRGRGWNEFTGHGIVDGAAAVALARRYDVSAPRVRANARRSGNIVAARVRLSRDRTEPGRGLAGGVSYGLLVSRDGGRQYSIVSRRRGRPISARVTLRGRRANVLLATACDRNGNCGIRRLGRFRP